MGDSLFNFSDATIYIDGCEVSGISDFEMDFTASDECIEKLPIKRIYTSESFTATCKFNIFTWHKVIGWWGWVEQNCPNKRLVWLMNHGRTYRVRRKNLIRAVREIAKVLRKYKGDLRK